MKQHRLAWLWLALVPLMIGAPGALRAQETPPTDEECQAYAKQAVKDAGLNSDRQCGMVGARYTLNYDDHYNWCRQTPRPFVLAERQARHDEITSCSICKSYVEATLDQFNHAFSDCASAPVSGPFWIPNTPEAHFAFCFIDQGEGANPRYTVNNDIDRHLSMRKADLTHCK